MTQGVAETACKENPPPRNAVHRQIDALARALHRPAGEGEAQRDKTHGDPAGLEPCLRVLLEALSWRGNERLIFEAMPHFDGLFSVHDLRAVLSRLDRPTRRLKGGTVSVRDGHFPCIYACDGRVYVLLGLLSDGAARGLLHGSG